jgi:GNAT superfamily N-acetyltransferase
MRTLRPYRDADLPAALSIINVAAEAYRGVIPADRWHEPYMPETEFMAEMAAGVQFWVCEEEAELLGVMGIQPVRDVTLVRHAYIRPGLQRGGVGTALLEHLRTLAARPMLVGTWSDAGWAIAFYRRNGFIEVDPARARRLLHEYWTIPERQIDTSVVLEHPG